MDILQDRSVIEACEARSNLAKFKLILTRSGFSREIFDISSKPSYDFGCFIIDFCRFISCMQQKAKPSHSLDQELIMLRQPQQLLFLSPSGRPLLLKNGGQFRRDW